MSGETQQNPEWTERCQRCGALRNIGSMVKVGVSPPAGWKMAVCFDCRKTNESYWSNCD